MKKMVLAFALAALAFSATAAFAQVDPAYRDNIGIYLDEAGTENCVNIPLSTPTTAYLVLTRLSANEVLGWEAKLTFDNVFVTSFADRGQAIDAGSREGEHVVGYASPLPAVGGNCVVADIGLLMVSPGPAYAFADEIYFSLLENGLPAYIDADSNGYALHPVFGETSDPIMIINGDCGPVAVQESTFGAVKSLYR